LSWTPTAANPNIYAASYSSTFEQMFCDGKTMLEARWPNVPTDANGDWIFFLPNVWSTVDATGKPQSRMRQYEE
jgi:hypothetical protein